MITSKYTVRRYSNKKNFESIQKLEKDFFLFGFKIWTITQDVEEVPIWASIESACLGSTQWKSKFSQYF